MKQVCAALVMMAATVTFSAQTPGRAQTTPAKPAVAMDKAGMEQAIKDNEQKVNEAVARGDVAAFKALVTDTGWTVDPGGVMSVLDFEKNFAQLKIDAGWKITESRIVWADTSTAIHIYKWTGSGTYMGQPVLPVTLSSTVWTNKGSIAKPRWMAVFHQETAPAGK